MKGSDGRKGKEAGRMMRQEVGLRRRHGERRKIKEGYNIMMWMRAGDNKLSGNDEVYEK